MIVTATKYVATRKSTFIIKNLYTGLKNCPPLPPCFQHATNHYAYHQCVMIAAADVIVQSVVVVVVVVVIVILTGD